MENGLVVTSRDERLLHDCYDHVFLTVSQIQERYFHGRTKSAAHNRLTRLRRAGLLKSIQVSTILYQREPKNIGVVYQVTRKGIAFLKQRYPQEDFRDETLNFTTSTLAHDVLLTEVTTALRHRFPGKVIIRGVLSKTTLGSKRIPDALVCDHRKRVEVAVELELTIKSARRYREIILQYQLDSNCPNVLYVVPGKTLFEKLRFKITGQKEIPGLPLPNTGKFYFVQVDTLLRSPLAAEMINGSETLILAPNERGDR
jgi:Replication-relaxation